MASKRKQNWVSFLNSLYVRGNQKILVLVHKGADVDAIASAGAFYFLFSKKNKIKIVVPEHINVNAKTFSQKMNIPYSVDPKIDFNSFDNLVVFDCSSKNMLSCYKEALDKKNLFVLDHHASGCRKQNFLINPKEVSTTMLLYYAFSKSKVKLSKKAATCLAAGISTDSANMILANHDVFRVMSSLLKTAEKKYSQILSLFSVPKDVSEKVSGLKAARRCKIYGSFNYVITTTEVGSFEAASAVSLLKLGSDVAFAAGIKKGSLLLCARANNAFMRETGFDLTKHVIPHLEEQFKGEGGGHPGAASFTLTANDSYAVLQQCLKRTHMFLEKKFRKSTPIKKY